MNDFLVYILKSVLGLGIFSLVYRISFMKEGNFIIRRFYLLFSVSLAFILPLIEFRLPAANSPLQSLFLDEITVYSNGIRMIKEHSAFPVARLFQIVYFAISGFFILRIFLDTTLIGIKSFKNPSEKNEGVKLFVTNDKNISYSFFKNIFIGQTSGPEEQEQILAHEKVHALQLHSLDAILMEILTGIFWINPFIWWYRTEIKNVHEYLADEGALRQGFNKKEYQITLLEHLIGSASFKITNNFNYSIIKNRIAMMNILKNGRKNHWKLFLLIPVSLVIILAFACTQKKELTDSAVNTAYFEADKMPVFPGGLEALQSFIASNITYPKEAAEKNVSGKVYVQFVVGKDGKIVSSDQDFQVLNDKKEATHVSSVSAISFKPSEEGSIENVDIYIDQLKAEAVRVISALPPFEKPGEVGRKPVAVVFTIPINFALK